jgi:hypothetical protein
MHILAKPMDKGCPEVSVRAGQDPCQQDRTSSCQSGCTLILASAMQTFIAERLLPAAHWSQASYKGQHAFRQKVKVDDAVLISNDYTDAQVGTCALLIIDGHLLGLLIPTRDHLVI